jgi:hypothetical protein
LLPAATSQAHPSFAPLAHERIGRIPVRKNAESIPEKTLCLFPFKQECLFAVEQSRDMNHPTADLPPKLLSKNQE